MLRMQEEGTYKAELSFKQVANDPMDKSLIANDQVKMDADYVQLHYDTIGLKGDFLVEGTDKGNWNKISYVSNRYTKHMSPNRELFVRLKGCFGVDAKSHNAFFLFTHRVGDVLIGTDKATYEIPSVSFVPEIGINVLNLHQFACQGFEVQVSGTTCVIRRMFEEANEEMKNYNMRKRLYRMPHVNSVARIETIRLILALATYNKWEVHHLDVKSAFLHGDLKEEVYVSQPDGFIKTEDKGKVYRLRKSGKHYMDSDKLHVLGQITLDGADIQKLRVKWLRQQTGLVNQEPVLFNDTIRANIAYGKEGNATEAEVLAAAELANAHIFISGLQQGYDTNVGERGMQLSGGQKQRVAIARAIIKAPKILLLDEATSALDAESEKVVQDALDQVMLHRTTIVVAHRLSTIRGADVIAVVKNGVIAEKGKHEKLINIKDGIYASLVTLHTSSSAS
uniref:ABC transporter B family member 21-like n=1 Tax=Tanacetum cinerariifolium TaxID=118510 RepID=A0A6L2M4L5_TANCI|nr:ABC transporter B family member 21-like [Tanacetum cinerariifolium]